MTSADDPSLAPDDTIEAEFIDAPLDEAEEAATQAVGRPWLPGQSGNPKGRPPKILSLTSKLKEKADKVCEYDIPLAKKQDREPRTWLEVWIDALAKAPIGGGPAALKALDMIFNRLEGKAKAVVTHEGEINHTGQIDHKHELAAANRDEMFARLEALRAQHVKALAAPKVVVESPQVEA